MDSIGSITMPSLRALVMEVGDSCPGKFDFTEFAGYAHQNLVIPALSSGYSACENTVLELHFSSRVVFQFISSGCRFNLRNYIM